MSLILVKNGVVLGGPSIFRRRSSGKKKRKIPLDKSFGSIRLFGSKSRKKLCSSSSSFGPGYIRESSIRFVYDDSKVPPKKILHKSVGVLLEKIGLEEIEKL